MPGNRRSRVKSTRNPVTCSATTSPRQPVPGRHPPVPGVAGLEAHQARDPAATPALQGGGHHRVAHQAQGTDHLHRGAGAVGMAQGGSTGTGAASPRPAWPAPPPGRARSAGRAPAAGPRPPGPGPAPAAAAAASRPSGTARSRTTGTGTGASITKLRSSPPRPGASRKAACSRGSASAGRSRERNSGGGNRWPAMRRSSPRRSMAQRRARWAVRARLTRLHPSSPARKAPAVPASSRPRNATASASSSRDMPRAVMGGPAG